MCHSLKMREIPESTCRKIVNTLKKDWVLIFTVVGVIVGFVIGLAIRPATPSKDALLWIGRNTHIQAPESVRILIRYSTVFCTEYH